MKMGGGGGMGGFKCRRYEEFRIILTLAPGAKYCKLLVMRDLQANNGQSFILYSQFHL